MRDYGKGPDFDRRVDHAPARRDANDAAPSAATTPEEVVRSKLATAAEALDTSISVAVAKLKAAQPTEKDHRSPYERRTGHDEARAAVAQQLIQAGKTREFAIKHAMQHKVDASAMLQAFDDQVKRARETFDSASTASPAPSRYQRIPSEEDIAAVIAMPRGPERNATLLFLCSQLAPGYKLTLERRIKRPDSEDEIARAFTDKTVIEDRVRADAIGILEGSKRLSIDPRMVRLPAKAKAPSAAGEATSPTHPDDSSTAREGGRPAGGDAAGAAAAGSTDPQIFPAPHAAGDDAPQKLPAPIRGELESATGRSLDHVAIHAGERGNTTAEAHGARAVAIGHDIHMAQGQLDTEHPQGRELLAHEVAHTVQADVHGGPTRAAAKRDGDATQAAEIEADDFAAEFQQRGGAARWTPTVAIGSSAPMRAPAPGRDPKKPGPGSGVPPALNVTFGQDLFRLRFEQGGDAKKAALDVSVDYTGPHPVEANGTPAKTLTLRQPLQQQPPLDAVVKLIEPTAVHVDAYRNDYDIVKIADEVGFNPEKKAREHKLRAQLFGKVGPTGAFLVRDPKAAPPAVAATGPAIDGDIPGQQSQVYKTGAHEWQVRLDCDGDQHKESLLEFKLVDTHPSGAAKTMQVAMTQLSSGTKVPLPAMTMADLGLPFDFPFVGPTFTNTDGAEPFWVWYKLATKPGEAYRYEKLVAITPPVAVGEKSQFSLFNTHGFAAQALFPKQLPEKNDKGTDPKQISDFWTSDLTLGPYNDKFRIAIEPTQSSQATLSIAPLERSKAKTAFALPITLPPKGMHPAILKHDGVGIQLDIDGDGKPDLELFTVVNNVTYMTLPTPAPEQEREIRFRIRGSALASEAKFEFDFHEGVWGTDPHASGPVNYAQGHQNNPIHATDTLNGQAQLDTFEKTLDSYEAMMMAERKKARDAKLISAELYDAWRALSQTVIRLRPMVDAFKADPTKVVDPSLRGLATAQALAFYARLKADTPAETSHTYSQYTGESHYNKYTDETRHEGLGAGVYGAGPAVSPAFAAASDAASWGRAFKAYETLVHGLDLWVIDNTKKARGDSSPEAQRLEYMTEMRGELGKIEDKKPIPIHATFFPDPKYDTSSGPTEVPLSLWYWEDGGTWHLRDLTNPKRPFEDTRKKQGSEKRPSTALFDELDTKIHFPKGKIFYQIPNGPGGTVLTTEHKPWYEWVSEIATIAAIVGMGLVTAGGAVAVAGGWALAASGLAGAVAAGGDMHDHAKHGALDADTFAIDLMQIIAGVAGFGAFGAGRIIVREAAAEAAAVAGTAAKAVPPPAWLAKMAKAAYLPLRVGSAGAQGLQMLAMTDQAIAQFKELDGLEKRGGNAASIDRAKRQIITGLLIQGGFTVLAIRGELPTLKQGMDLIITMKGKTPLAHVEGQLDPHTIKFSQENVGATTREGMTVADLTSSMANEGWKGDPIHVVQLEDGSLVSLDNRRLMAARTAIAEHGGLKGPGGKVQTIPTEVHSFKEPIPQDWAQDGFVAEKNVYRLEDGSLSTTSADGAELVIKKGQVASTYGEAATIRTANQGKFKEGPNKGQRFPIGGTHQMPRIRKPSGGGGGGTPPPDGGGGGNDVGATGGTQVDVNASNDPARIQTKVINDAIEKGDSKIDFDKPSKDHSTTLGAEYKKWVESKDPVDFSSKTPKANYKGHPEFKADIDALVADGKIAEELRIKQRADAFDSLKIKLDPASSTYEADRAKLADKFGVDVVAKWEAATLGDASDVSRRKVFKTIDQIVSPDAITKLRNAFPDCEIYITGKTTRAGGPDGMAKIDKLEIMLVVPEATDGPGKSLYEDRARTLSVPTTPEFAQKTGRSVLAVDATARTKAQAFGAITEKPAAGGAPEFARVDANVPENASQVKATAGAHDAAAAAGTSHEGPEAPKPKTRVTEPVKGLFEGVKTEPKISDWKVEDKITLERDGTKVANTTVTTPDGKVGWVQRAYNPTTKQFEMRNAFLDEIPSWVNEGGPRLDARGIPTVHYLTIRQMKLLGVDYGGYKKVKMSTIQNVRGVIEFNVLRAAGVDEDAAILKTHSVEYGETTIQQSGERVVGAKVQGGKTTPLQRMLGWYERQCSEKGPIDPAIVAKHDKLIAKYGKGVITRDTQVRWDYDIYLDVEPFAAGTPEVKSP